MHLIRAKTLYTGLHSRPIDDGAILHDGHTITTVGSFRELSKEHHCDVNDLGDVTLAPGLVNAHCHLKLAKLAGKTTTGKGFVPWLQSRLQQNYRETDGDAVAALVAEAKAAGLCCIADTLTSDDIDIIQRILVENNIYHLLFCEAFGFSQVDCHPDQINYGLHKTGRITGAAHALYSTRAKIVQQVKAKNTRHGQVFSIHLAEHDDEVGMLMGLRTGYFKMLEKFNMIGPYFAAPLMSPVAHAHSLGLLNPDTLAVHCVKLSEKDIGLLKDSGTNICLCPRSNNYIGVGRGPWEKLLATGLNICLGTDSIASNYDLNLYNELAYFLDNLKHHLPFDQGLALITKNPAKALKVDTLFGTIEPGKRSCFSVVPENLLDRYRS